MRHMAPVSAIILMALVLAACGGAAIASPHGAGASVAVSPTPLPTGSPSNAVTPVLSASPGLVQDPDEETRPMFQNWALATVRVNGLKVRVDPRIDAPLVNDPQSQLGTDGARLNDGDHVLVVSDAVAGDGVWWLLVAIQRPDPFGSILVGWAAAGTRQEPWIEEDNAWCPREPRLDVLLTLSGIERLGCYASAPITIEAYQATLDPNAGLGGVCGDEPSWLACDHINYNWVNRDGSYDWEFLLHFDPATGIPQTQLAPDGSRRKLRIVGHFDDDAATRCAPDQLMTLEDHAAYLGCAVLFVVDQLEPTGG